MAKRRSPSLTEAFETQFGLLWCSEIQCRFYQFKDHTAEPNFTVLQRPGSLVSMYHIQTPLIGILYSGTSHSKSSNTLTELQTVIA